MDKVNMHIHILGICGKFMAGLAVIAKERGLQVTGSDKNTQGPLADMLRSFGIEILEGYEANSIPESVDAVIIGNALTRGVPVIEQILNENIHFYSGPQWLYEHVLRDKWVIAVAGTHGKTTTTSMIAWILEQSGYEPGFLVGGNPCNFNASARYTTSNFFVIEADEYDTAFFDKRSKFVHYNPRTLIINNLEFDHADIFNSLDDIKRQFNHLLRIVPNNGLIICPSDDHNVNSVLAQERWTPIENFGSKRDAWSAQKIHSDGSEFDVFLNNNPVGKIKWDLIGDHNVRNALAAIAAARNVGITSDLAIKALSNFLGVKRRLERRGIAKDITIYDDFAHHPTAIATTLRGLRQRVGQNERIFAVLEFASNTMRGGYHEESISTVFDEADNVIFLKPNSEWQIENQLTRFKQPVAVYDNVDEIVKHLINICRKGDHIVCMSNHHFDGIHQKLLDRLKNRLECHPAT